MKLQHVVEDYSAVALAEPPANFPNLSDPSIAEYGSFDGYSVMVSFQEEKIGRVYFFVTDIRAVDDVTTLKNENVMAYVTVSANETSDGFNELYECWSNPKHRGKGFATGLIRFLMQKLGMKLLLGKDEIVSSYFRAFLKNAVLGKYRKFHAYHRDMTKYEPDELLRILNKAVGDDSEIVLWESKREIPLFANRKIDKQGQSCFVESMGTIQPQRTHDDWLD